VLKQRTIREKRHDKIEIYHTQTYFFVEMYLIGGIVSGVLGTLIVTNTVPKLVYAGMMYRDIRKSVRLSNEFEQKHTNMPIRIATVKYQDELNKKYGSAYKAPKEEKNKLEKMQNDLSKEYTKLYEKHHPKDLKNKMNFYWENPPQGLFYRWIEYKAYTKDEKK
jgi:hypothetical protein